MKDPIERQDAIDAVNSHFGFSVEEEYGSAVQEVINRLPPAQSKQRWIPCSKRLPEDDEDVLVSDGIDCAVAFWRSDADAWDDPLHGWLDSFEFKVKAWMPLPEPYKEEGEQDESFN